jgi:two-component system NtrC family sensor kinase
MRGRISYKLIAATCAVVIVSVSVFAYFLLSSHQRQLIADVERSANQLSETIKSSTRYDMLLNRPESVHQIISTIGKQEGIEKVRIFNKEGEVILSTDARDIGRLVDKETEECDRCHSADRPLETLPVSERTRIFESAAGVRTFGIINPIYNEPGCSNGGCHAHSEDQKVLGVLDITMPLDAVDRDLRAGQMRLLTFAVLAIVAISLMTYWLVEYIVLKPIGKIVEATQKIAAGDLNHTLEIRTRDEIGKLGESFNVMMGELADAQRQLIQSNKLSSMGRLAAGVAHEINNPLTGVLTYSSFLLKKADEDDELKEDLNVIVRETIRCRDIVKSLLDFSRQSVSEKRPIQVNETIQNAYRIVQNQLAIQKIRVDLQLQEDLPLIEADKNQIQQVLVNLLVNAADATGDDGGVITVRTDVVERPKPDEGHGASDEWVRIRVSDTGCGIPKEQLGKIFDPFFTTKVAKGTGLGLAIAWGIVEKHNGELEVASEVGKGTTFTILLPKADSTAWA